MAIHINTQLRDRYSLSNAHHGYSNAHYGYGNAPMRILVTYYSFRHDCGLGYK